MTTTKSAILWLNKLLTAKTEGIKQGFGRLGDAQIGYCCFGYGCHILKIEHDSRHVFSNEFEDRVGLIWPHPKPPIVRLNDSYKWPLKKIAEHLIKFPEHYFDKETASGVASHFYYKEN